MRVRILVDDIHLIGGDRAVAALNQHPQIEVRLFNPAKGRSGSSVLYGIEFLGNVKQLNQRMHNKLIESLDELTLDAQQEILVSTPYFIPDDEFYKTVPALLSRGVKAVILTNSLGSTNHPIVHSAYKKHRKRVIELGVQLFEMRYDAAAREDYDTPPVESKAFGLHAKAIIVDRQFVYVGSLNLDPRSIYLNTEFGLIIESPDFAEAVANEFETGRLPENS